MLMRVGAFSEGKGLGSCDGNAGTVGLGVDAAVSSSACPVPVMVLAVRLGCERWRGLLGATRILTSCSCIIIFLRTLCTTHIVVVNNNKVRAQLP